MQVKRQHLIVARAAKEPTSKRNYESYLLPLSLSYMVAEEEVVLGTFEIEYEEPDVDTTELMQKMIETLRAKQKRLDAQCYQAKRKLEEKINELLLLEHVSEPVSSKTNFPDDDIPF